MKARSTTVILLAALISLSAQAQVSCGDVISSNRTLTHDLECGSGWIALDIVGSDVTLDLNGYTLAGDIFKGIYVNADRVTIRGPGVIKGFGLGIQARDSDDLSIVDVYFHGLDQGVSTLGGERLRLTGNLFHEISGDAVSVRGYDNGSTVLPTRGARIHDNQFYRTLTGVRICGANATGHLVEKNEFFQLGDYGIHLETGTSGNTIRDNWVGETYGTGIRITNSSGNRVTGNYLDRGNLGISLHDNNGHFSPTCAQPMAPVIVTGNRLDHNTIRFHDTAVSLGLGVDAMPRVLTNRIEDSKLYDNAVGIGFREDAWRNTASRNAFHRTTTPVRDDGTANVH